MKRILLLMVMTVLLLSACADANVSYRLGDDNSVSIDYLVELEQDSTDAALYASAITQYWTNKDFNTTSDEKEGLLTISGSKSTASGSPEEAAQAFSSMLSGEDSLLQYVSFVYTPSFEYDKYSLSTSVSLKDIIRQNQVQNIPDGEIKALEGDATDGNYTLSISLPGDVVSTNADSNEGGVCSWKLAYGEVTQITLETSKFNQENKDYYAQLTEQQRKDEQLLLLCGGAAAVLLAALVIVAIMRSRKKRPLKVHVKKF